MKETDFFNWLVGNGQQENSARTVVSRVKRIEEAYPELDSRFEDGSIQMLLNVFTYTKSDESNKRIPLHKIEIDGNPYTGTQSLKNALTQYIEFMHSEMADGVVPNNAETTESDKTTPNIGDVMLYKTADFREWMRWCGGMTQGSANSYVSYLKTLRHKVTRKSDGAYALDLISDLLKEGNTAVALKLLDKVEEKVSEHMLSSETDESEKKDFNNYRSALRKYILFLQDDLEELPDEEELNNVEAFGVDLMTQFDGDSNDKTSGTLTYPISDIKQNFIFRLKTQNRMSNQKDIFYPIGMICKLFNYSQREAKRKDIYNNDADWLNEWFKDYVDSILVITADGEYPLSKIKEIIINPNEGSVNLLLEGCCDEHKVFTETMHEGDASIPMQAKRLQDIHIDHTPLMASVLSTNLANLPALNVMSEIIKKYAKQKQLDIKPSNFGKISKQLFKNTEVVNEQLLPLIPKLKNELDILRGECVLKLMQASLNLKKK
ncbi:MAG: hypothetical protein K2K40_00355 [Paramuribaculum sp.]|nr:hypothetical protein [Paramuribaculum sp.]